MSLFDCLWITLFNAVICIALPKTISLFLAAKAKAAAKLSESSTATSNPELAPQQPIAEPASI